MYWIIFGMGVFFIILGYLLKYAKWYWLIAGYNTATSDEKKHIDIEGLSHTMGIGLFAGGIAMLLFGIGTWAGFTLPGQIAMILIPVLLCLYLVWNGQKYTVKPAASSREINIGMSLVLGLPLLAIVAVIAIGIFYSSKPSIITSTPQQIHISGSYGVTAELEDVQEIKLLNVIPPIEWKSNGFGFASVRKGKFHLQEWGEGRLYLISDSPPFIYIKTSDGYMLINYKDPKQTNEVYQALHTHWKI